MDKETPEEADTPEPPPPMLDPDWTPQQGYSHAHELMRKLGLA